MKLTTKCLPSTSKEVHYAFQSRGREKQRPWHLATALKCNNVPRQARYFKDQRAPTRCFCTSVKEDPVEDRTVEIAWEHLDLLKRRLRSAVEAEDYVTAAQLRDQAKAMEDTLPPVTRYLYHQVALLRGSGSSVREKLEAMRILGETGTSLIVPALVNCLLDPALHDAAHEAIWNIFMRHHDPQVRELMSEGMNLITRTGNRAEALLKALDVFNKVVELDASFAEGYNKRATVLYLMERFEDSIADCKKTLELMPYHFGAASGMGLCHIQLEEMEEALAAFNTALSIDPNLPTIARLAEDLKQSRDEEGR